MYRVDKIANLIVEEALERPIDDIGVAIAIVKMEIMRITMDLMSEVRQAERKCK